MTNENNAQQLLMQVSRARETLGNALGLVQDLDAVDLDLSSIVELLAASVRALFTAQEQNLQSADPISEAMQHMRDILKMMQDVQESNASLHAATSTVARILAILFPVYKALSTPPPRAEAANEPPLKPREKKTPQHDERRSTPRQAIQADIGFQSESNFFTGFSTDISSGGLFVATYDMPPIGALVNLNFQIPRGSVISVDGEVRWSREFNETTPDMPPGVGVRFVNLSDSDAKKINSYMRSVEPLFFDES